MTGTDKVSLYVKKPIKEDKILYHLRTPLLIKNKDTITDAEYTAKKIKSSISKNKYNSPKIIRLTFKTS